MTKLIKWLLLLLILNGGLAACLKNGMQADGGIGGTGVNHGVITGFGSIIVNGMHFALEQATIEIDGVTATEELLQPGMVVTVYGKLLSQTQGNAQRVVFTYNLKGMIDALLDNNAGFIAQGQTVLVDALTVFQGTNFADLTVGSPVQVNGVTGSNGILLARYLNSSQLLSAIPSYTNNSVGEKSRVAFVTLTGEVAALDTNQQRFALSQQKVDYSSVVFVNMTSAELVNGVPILVEGYLQAGVVMAEQIKFQRLEATTGQAIQLHGLVSEMNGLGRFKLSAQQITFNAQTKFIAGTVHDVANNVALTINGIVENDTVNAERIEFKPTTLTRLAAPIDKILGNNLMIAGIFAQVRDTTLMLDSSSMALRHFTVANLAIGDVVIVYGYTTNSGIELERLERVDQPHP